MRKRAYKDGAKCKRSATVSYRAKNVETGVVFAYKESDTLGVLRAQTGPCVHPHLCYITVFTILARRLTREE